MLFPTHLLVGDRLARWVAASRRWTIVGAALPDVLDKSLALGGIVGGYHSVAHAGWFPFLLAAGIMPSRRRIGRGVVLGVASHLALDATHMMLNGRGEDVRFLLWPFIRHEPAVDLGPVAFTRAYLGTTAFLFETVLWVVVGGTFLVRRYRERQPTDHP